MTLWVQEIIDLPGHTRKLWYICIWEMALCDMGNCKHKNVMGFSNFSLIALTCFLLTRYSKMRSKFKRVRNEHSFYLSKMGKFILLSFTAAWVICWHHIVISMGMQVPKTDSYFWILIYLDSLQLFRFGDRNINDLNKGILKERICLYQFFSRKQFHAVTFLMYWILWSFQSFLDHNYKTIFG